ncbi:MAG TPA: MFS transporter [Stellaceae bacterium]|jgi:MFS family permease|nr:MFS transporter [Stellaceae bacterium]
MSAPSAIAAPQPNSRRIVFMLAGCQALAMTSMSILATVAAIIGNLLAADKALSTLPVALQMTGMMSATIPAALLMARVGRRRGFWTGSALGATGGVVAGLACWAASFPLFCVGTFLIGCSNGFAQQYRFAAAEAADDRFRSKAISLVLAGGVISGTFGPEFAQWSRDLFAPALFAGCFAMVVVLQGAAATLLYFTTLPPPPPRGQIRGVGRPLTTIIAQPIFIVALLSGMIGYGVMSLVMTATPIAMIGCGFMFPDAALVIQWHILGMYAPSFFTGHLIVRFGLVRVMGAGAALLLVCCGINLAGMAEGNFWAANMLLGVGWNFLFIGATTLLTRAYRPEERAKVQAFNDFMIFGISTVSSFSSGALLAGFGWATVQYAVLPAVAVATAAVVWLRLQAGRAEPQYAGL